MRAPLTRALEGGQETIFGEIYDLITQTQTRLQYKMLFGWSVPVIPPPSTATMHSRVRVLGFGVLFGCAVVYHYRARIRRVTERSTRWGLQARRFLGRRRRGTMPENFSYPETRRRLDSHTQPVRRPRYQTYLHIAVLSHQVTLHRKHVLAKWKAIKMFDQLRDRPADGCFDLPEESADGVINRYLSHDGESFYMDRAVRDMRGVLADQRICENDASDVRGYSLREGLRRVVKKEDRMVEEKWKPIMAERNKRLKSEPEAEDHQNVEGQVPTAVEQQEDESMPIKLEQPANSLAPIFGQDRHTIPVIYVGNDLPETSTKRKRDNLGQSQEPVRRRPFAPKTSKTALGRPMGTAVEVTERSSAVAHVPSSPLGTVEMPLSKIKRCVISTSEDGQNIPIIENTNGASLNPTTEVTPSLTPAM